MQKVYSHHLKCGMLRKESCRLSPTHKSTDNVSLPAPKRLFNFTLIHQSSQSSPIHHNFTVHTTSHCVHHFSRCPVWSNVNWAQWWVLLWQTLHHCPFIGYARIHILLLSIPKSTTLIVYESYCLFRCTMIKWWTKPFVKLGTTKERRNWQIWDFGHKAAIHFINCQWVGTAITPISSMWHCNLYMTTSALMMRNGKKHCTLHLVVKTISIKLQGNWETRYLTHNLCGLYSIN